MTDIIGSTAQKHFGIESLYPQQRIVIANILGGAGFFGSEEAAEAPKKQLVLLPTGMGKSICFMLPCLLMEPLTLVIFPLLSLMQDQKRRFTEAGIGSVLFRGGQSKQEREGLYQAIEEKKAKVVLINPELLAIEEVAERIARFGPIHLVLDEVHTLPEWGETFRPAYLEVGSFAARKEVKQITAFTATASKRICDKVKELLFAGEDPFIVSELPDRPNIHYRVLPVLSRLWKLAELLAPELTPELAPGQAALPRPAIIFCRTRRETEECARFLTYTLKEDCIRFFHAGLEREEKDTISEWFFSSDEGILCATTAYGMGVDKKNVRSVIHHKPAPSVEAFLQESGRAGRDRKPSLSVVLLSSEDIPTPESDSRYRNLLHCFIDAGSCRREALLALLDAHLESCSGCDVCDGTSVQEPESYTPLYNFFRRYPHRFFLSEAVDHLAPAWFDKNREKTKALLDAMVSAGVLKVHQRGPWKGLVFPGKRSLY